MDEDLIQSSDCFRTIQTVSMDATGNQVQDRIHDFFPLRLPRVESNSSRRRFHERIRKDRTVQSPGIHGNAIWRDVYDIAAPGLWPAGRQSGLV